MGISRNTRSLPDFPEFAQQLGMVSPELHVSDDIQPCKPNPSIVPDEDHASNFLSHRRR